VEKNGRPRPAAKITTRPFSRCRIALRGMYGSAIWAIEIAVCTRVTIWCRSSASCRTSAFMTVPSIPT
jgi:hypothetical protein